jgi:hypothetical protein
MESLKYVSILFLMIFLVSSCGMACVSASDNTLRVTKGGRHEL